MVAPASKAPAAMIFEADSLTNNNTGVTNGGRREASSAALCGVTARGLGAYSTKPMASAPAATAASTSCSRVRPQILMRVRMQGRGSGFSDDGLLMVMMVLRAANHTQPCGWAGPNGVRRPGPENTGRRAKRWVPQRRVSAQPALRRSIAVVFFPAPRQSGTP